MDEDKIWLDQALSIQKQVAKTAKKVGAEDIHWTLSVQYGNDDKIVNFGLATEQTLANMIASNLASLHEGGTIDAHKVLKFVKADMKRRLKTKKITHVEVGNENSD